MLILTGMFQSFISLSYIKNRPLQCKFVFGGYHTSASEKTFASGPLHGLYTNIYRTEIIFSLRNTKFYKWCIFKAAQCR